MNEGSKSSRQTVAGGSFPLLKESQLHHLTHSSDTSGWLTTVLHLLVRLILAVGHTVAGQLVVDALAVAALKLGVDVAGGVFSWDGTEEGTMKLPPNFSCQLFLNELNPLSCVNVCPRTSASQG